MITSTRTLLLPAAVAHRTAGSQCPLKRSRDAPPGAPAVSAQGLQRLEGALQRHCGAATYLGTLQERMSADYSNVVFHNGISETWTYCARIASPRLAAGAIPFAFDFVAADTEFVSAVICMPFETSCKLSCFRSLPMHRPSTYTALQQLCSLSAFRVLLEC